MFVHVLGLAVFAQGTSEFMLSGLVPGIARDLSVSVAAAASLTSAYAIGMVAGAPLMAAWSARWPRRGALAGFLAAFVVVHVVGAVTPNFAVLFATRIVAAVVNAGFLAVAMSVATSLVAPGKQARATAVLLSGVTLACVAGVPAGALLGERAGWRAAFWAVAALCLPALALVFRSAPADAAGRAEVRVRREIGVLRARPVRSALALAAAVNGATFATFAYLAVIATDTARLPEAAVPGLLAAFGAGAFAGVTVAGRQDDGGQDDGGRDDRGKGDRDKGDRDKGERGKGERGKGDGRPRRGLLLASAALPVGWAALALAGTAVVPLFVLATVQGALSFGVGSALVNRALRAASDAPALGGSFATAALNVGAFAGPLLAGAATAATGDQRTAAWVSAALAAAGTAPAAAAARRARLRRRPDTYA
ncbi:MFS transporter [Streptomyces sp.]|uniref:MFS transporter n=1 Tax=Streptomyces sp. TaxID=1931 RepID=UPI002D528B1D|nr:MFS transporter [Streptomyces sp.]HZF88859.1 MFS transporter [Streptomyces sp.]